MTTNAVSVVENTRSALSADALHDITDFASAMQIMEAAGIVAESISDYGTGFTVADKNRLVGVPFIIVEWRFNNGAYTDENGEKRQFVSAALITKNNEKLVINDGGTGVALQLANVTAKRVARKHATPQNGLLVPGGLTVSNYTWTDDKGHEQPGTTYYLSESAEVSR